MRWLSRIPMTIGEAKELVSTLLSPDFISSSVSGYCYATRKSNYGGIEQRLYIDRKYRKKRICNSRKV